MDKPFPAYSGDEPYIFVCYAHDDSALVYPEIAWLDEQGTNIWYDEGISAGKNWRTAIGESLLAASRILVYVSAASLKSDHCNREINLALDEAKEIVPVYLEETELTADLKVGLSRVQALHRNQGLRYQQLLLNTLGGESSDADAQPPVASGKKLTRRRYSGLGIIIAGFVGLALAWALFEGTAYRPAPLSNP